MPTLTGVPEQGQIVTVRQGRFRRVNVGQSETALREALDGPVSTETQQRLKALWPALRSSLMNALEARMNYRIAGMERLLRQRATKETGDIVAVLRGLAAAIENELAEPEYRQLALFSTAERTQLTRNTQTLQARLSQIPGEIESEQDTIQARYANPQPRIFPGAVTLFVPKRLDR